MEVQQKTENFSAFEFNKSVDFGFKNTQEGNLLTEEKVLSLYPEYALTMGLAYIVRKEFGPFPDWTKVQCSGFPFQQDIRGKSVSDMSSPDEGQNVIRSGELNENGVL